MNSGALLTLSVLCHLSPLNTMEDDASRRFDLHDNNFLFFFWSKYCPSQSASLWIQCHLPPGITSCVISVLRRRMYGPATWLTPARLLSTTSLENYAPRCRSSIGSMILPSQWQISFRCTANGSVTDTGLSSLKSARNRCLRCGKLSPRSTFWMDALTPKNHVALPPATLASASAARSACTPSRTPPRPLTKILPPLGLLWRPPGAQVPILRISA